MVWRRRLPNVAHVWLVTVTATVFSGGVRAVTSWVTRAFSCCCAVVLQLPVALPVTLMLMV
jgi:hypothetical protein